MNDKNSEPNKDTKSNSNAIEEELSQEIKDIIQYIPDEKKDEVLKVITAQSIEQKTFSGPLPPPAILEKYNNIIENGAERIMKMAENQSKHRIELEKYAIKEELRQSNNGQKYGFVLAIIGMLIALLLAYIDHGTVAGIFGTTTIIGLVTTFVIGKTKKNKKPQEQG